MTNDEALVVSNTYFNQMMQAATNMHAMLVQPPFDQTIAGQVLNNADQTVSKLKALCKSLNP